MYECILCKKQFKELNELEKHIRRNHQLHSNSEEVLKYLKALKIRDDIIDNEEVPLQIEPDTPMPKKFMKGKKKVKK